jgi:RNA polymerase sigma factor (sigma-70 family)
VQSADGLAGRFENERKRLQAVAYRMLGSTTEAEDAVQEAWLRLSSSNAEEIDNLGGWLTTVVGRISLNMLQSRKVRGEDSDVTRLPDPVLTLVDPSDPEQLAILADSVGLAMLVVLDSLSPAERLAYVLHEMFDMSFEEIARVIDRSPTASRQLASRGRRRVRTAAVPDRDRAKQQLVADAFLVAAREGDFEKLLAVLDPNTVMHIDGGTERAGASKIVLGARTVAMGILHFGKSLTPVAVWVNGTPGFMGRRPDGALQSILALTIKDGRIVELHALTDSARLEHVTVTEG